MVRCLLIRGEILIQEVLVIIMDLIGIIVKVMVIIMETGISDNQQMFLMDMDLNIVYRMIVLRHPHMQIVT